MFHLLDSREGINAFLKENGSYSAKSKNKKTKKERRKKMVALHVLFKFSFIRTPFV